MLPAAQTGQPPRLRGPQHATGGVPAACSQTGQPHRLRGLPHHTHSHAASSAYSRQRQRSGTRAQGLAVAEIASIASAVQDLMDTIVQGTPAPLQPAVQVVAGDVASAAALAPTLPGVARLAVSCCGAAARVWACQQQLDGGGCTQRPHCGARWGSSPWRPHAPVAPCCASPATSAVAGRPPTAAASVPPPPPHARHSTAALCCPMRTLTHTHTLIATGRPAPQGLYYLLGTTPNPVLGALDFYVLSPLGQLFKRSYDAPNFVLREKCVAAAAARARVGAGCMWCAARVIQRVRRPRLPPATDHSRAHARATNRACVPCVPPCCVPQAGRR
jgi:hypothetical protein